jgi:uracil-DNA glycosylase family 4
VDVLPTPFPAEPAANCGICVRLADFRRENATNNPEWFNGPVPSFGDTDARFLIVGLAPGLKGANRTGRPFTGDYAGDLLYDTLDAFGWSSGRYASRADDGLLLKDCMITNAVRCVPPANKPTTAEIKHCCEHLKGRIAALPKLSVLLALGRIAHDAVLTAFALKKSAFGFGHGKRHELPTGHVLFDSFHCSRYNTNTGRLTPEMFRAVFADVSTELERD